MTQRRLFLLAAALVVATVLASLAGSAATRVSALTFAGALAGGACLFWGARELLSRCFGGSGVLAVARVVVDEALRKRGIGSAAVALLVLVCALPLLLDEGARVAYRAQSYLTYALGVSTLALTVLAVFMSCETLASEITNKQIHLPAVKPIGRGRYLVGKWLGLLTVQTILLVVLGGTIAFLTWVPSVGATAEDQQALENGVLTSRRVIVPEPPQLAPGERLSDRAWRSLTPGESETYSFAGLDSTAAGAVLRIRIKAFHSQAPLRVLLQLDGGEERSLVCVPEQVHEVPLAESLLADSRLEVTVTHPADEDAPPFIFSRYEGLRVVYPEGGYAGNVLRALLLLWVRLGVVSMAGLFASSFLGFPVACLAVLLFVGTSTVSEFLVQDPHLRPETSVIRNEAHSHGHSHGHGHGHSHSHSRLGWADLTFRYLEVWGFRTAQALSLYERYDPQRRLVDGERIEWREVGNCLLGFGGGAGGSLGVLAWLVLRRRELARVQV